MSELAGTGLIGGGDQRVARARVPGEQRDAQARRRADGGVAGRERPAPATFQLKTDGVFVSIRGRDLRDITQAIGALPAQLARLDTRREERRLVYAEGAWRIDP